MKMTLNGATPATLRQRQQRSVETIVRVPWTGSLMDSLLGPRVAGLLFPLMGPSALMAGTERTQERV